MKHLTSEQRYEIYLGRKRGWSRSRIAAEIGVHPSTVSRELTRNVNSNGEYVWLNAQAKSEARKQGLEGNHRKPPELWWRIERMIVEEDWSPAQIAGVLRKGCQTASAFFRRTDLLYSNFIGYPTVKLNFNLSHILLMPFLLVKPAPGCNAYTFYIYCVKSIFILIPMAR